MIKNILVVEDNPVNTKLFNDLLKAKGYEVSTIGRGDQALDSARKILPDLILLDMQLPGMSGYMVTRFLKTDPEVKHIPVIAVTTYTMMYDREKAIKAGCDEYVSKPIDIKDLLKKINKFIGPGSTQGS